MVVSVILFKTQHAQLESEVRSENEETGAVEKRQDDKKEEVVVGEGDAPDPCSKLQCKEGNVKSIKLSFFLSLV